MKRSALCTAVPMRVLALVVLSVSYLGCRSTPTEPGATGESVVVRATGAGQVTRVLASEGTKVEAGTPLLELAPEAVPIPSTTPKIDKETRAVNDVETADREVDASRAEVVLNEANVQRLTPLVAAGQASQAELDGARAQYDQAQQRLQRAQDYAQKARGGLLEARQQSGNTGSIVSTSTPKKINVNAPVAGTVTVIGARVGDRIIVDQPVATIRAN